MQEMGLIKMEILLNKHKHLDIVYQLFNLVNKYSILVNNSLDLVNLDSEK